MSRMIRDGLESDPLLPEAALNQEGVVGSGSELLKLLGDKQLWIHNL